MRCPLREKNPEAMATNDDWMVFDNFVDMPGVVEIRTTSDDPTFIEPPVDLFEQQRLGLPRDFGKKDKYTTQQMTAYCSLCEVEVKNVKTLRAHCKGDRHLDALADEKGRRNSQAKRRGGGAEYSGAPATKREKKEEPDSGDLAVQVPAGLVIPAEPSVDTSIAEEEEKEVPSRGQRKIRIISPAEKPYVPESPAVLKFVKECVFPFYYGTGGAPKKLDDQAVAGLACKSIYKLFMHFKNDPLTAEQKVAIRTAVDELMDEKPTIVEKKPAMQ